jgi:hypothetical protein
MAQEAVLCPKVSVGQAYPAQGCDPEIIVALDESLISDIENRKP